MSSPSCYRHYPSLLILLFLLSSHITAATTDASLSSPLSCRGGSGSSNNGECKTNHPSAMLVDSILQDIQSSIHQKKSSETKEGKEEEDNNSKIVSLAKSSFASHLPSEKGDEAWKFLHGLSSSSTFVSEVWQKRPLLIRRKETVMSDATYNDDDDGGWVNGLFTVEDDLRNIDGTYISGHRTADILRNGTKTDTWEFRSIKDDLTRKTTWEEVKEALEGGTIYFNTAGSLWPTLGALCLLTTEAFGLPANVNVYITPPGITTSVPPHTDRQDVIVFQTAGAKRWRVYAPPPRRKGVDPLNRGKVSDVLSFEELGEPLIDAVIKKGDVLYVPAGFPHTTDTCTVVDDNDPEEKEGADKVFDETSVHLTMGLDTHVWALTYAHLRWSLLQRAGKNFQLNIEDDEAYWDAMRAISVGFLGGEEGRQCWQNIREEGGGELDEKYKSRMIEDLKRVMIRLEPNRWNIEGEDSSEARESLPTDEEFGDVVDYFVRDHLLPLIEIQEEMFRDVDPYSEETLIKAFKATQKQNTVMEKFGAFSKSEAMRKSFEQSRLAREAKTKGMM